MDDSLDITEVCRRTGLTSRALRFYEARGLLSPLRTYSGRRLYGPRELERIQEILALKRAGLTLAKIQALTSRKPLDLSSVVEAQLRAIDAQRRDLEEARTLLLSVKSRINRGEPVDAATFCSLIRQGETIMQDDEWKAILKERYSPEELQHWERNPPPAHFDQADYSRKWKDLGDRVQAALPLEPASEKAQMFVAEWDALLEPFKQVATPQMMQGAQNFWEDAEQYRGRVELPFSGEVMAFIQEARAAGSKVN
jgi:DNA-binding transcriptional MerR regulator